ncbi:hypothetical protein AB4365_06470 [Vibrio breoganii]
MNIIETIRQVLQQTKKEGHTSISIEAFENYLTNIESQDKAQLERDLALFKAQNDSAIAHSNNVTTSNLEMFKSVIATGQAALKASMVVNGGAAVALLAFMGKIWNSTIDANIAYSLSASMKIFCIGVVLGAFATGTTYLSQTLHSLEHSKSANSLNLITVLSVLASYALFIYGAFKAATAFGVHFAL